MSSNQCWNNADFYILWFVSLTVFGPIKIYFSFFFLITEDIVVWRESGENVTLECSLAKCPSSIDGFVGMYLYHDLKKCAEVLYYHSSPKYDKITPRIGYLERVEMKGSLKKNTVTISNLTVGDSGIYRCVYRGNVATQLKCNVYNLFVLGEFFLFLPLMVVTHSTVQCY